MQYGLRGPAGWSREYGLRRIAATRAWPGAGELMITSGGTFDCMELLAKST